MPAAYAAPEGNLPPGKTVYLGIRHERGILTLPAESERGEPIPAGVRIADIRDGASNTLCVVEARPEQAVIWTKPDDFEPSDRNPMEGLMGARKGGFLGLICDGSVHMFSPSLDVEAFKAMMTRDGGEVTMPRYRRAP
jgi:hypothetical protein